MMNKQKSKLYAARLQHVLSYIEHHLDEELAVDQLCSIAHFSKFHFHRQFANYTGITVARYVLLLRLKQASYRIAFEESVKIIDIALNAGFETPESFTRAFKHAVGKSPSAFRKEPDWESWHKVFDFRLPERNHQVNVDIIHFESTLIAVKEHLGPVEKLNNTIGQFIAWRKATGLSPKHTSKTFGIAYDNPDTAAPAQFRFDIAGEVKSDIPENAHGVIMKTIPGGRCAVVRHLGSHTRLGESIYPLYREWLPHSGEELRDFPLYFQYLNLLPDIAEADLVTDIYLPLK